MKIKIILLLGFFGVLMGFATVYGYIIINELLYWLFIYLVCALVLANTVKEKYFRNGFVLGLILSIVVSAIQIILFDDYLLNNLQLKGEMEKLPASIEPKTFFILIAPLIAILSGLIVGIFTTAFKKFFRKPERNTL